MQDLAEQQRKKRALLQQYANRQQMSAYKDKQQKYNNVGGAYNALDKIGRLGQWASKNSSSQALQKLGGAVYKYSPAGLKDTLYKGIDKGFGQVADKVKGLFGGGTVTGGAAPVSDLAQGASAITDTANAAGNVANTAGTAANTAGTAASTAGSALGAAGGALGVGTSALDMANNGVNFDNAKDMAVHGASLAAAATGVGVPIAAAIELGNGIYNMISGGKKQKAAETMQEGQKALNEADARKQEILQGFNQTQQPIVSSPDELKQQIGQEVFQPQQTPQEQPPIASNLYGDVNQEQQPEDQSIDHIDLGSISEDDIDRELLRRQVLRGAR